MTYEEIYKGAVQMLNEDPSSDFCDDYERRAGYLLATFTSLALPMDKLHCEANNLLAPTASNASFVELETQFPLSALFAPAATYYLAAMLVLDENEDLSDKLFALYVNEIATIQSSLRAKSEKTADRYGLLH